MFKLDTQTIVFIVVFIILFYVARAGMREGYDPNKQYAEAPSYDPSWLLGSAAYYSPYRYGYWPYHGLFPFVYRPYGWY